MEPCLCVYVVLFSALINFACSVCDHITAVCGRARPINYVMRMRMRSCGCTLGADRAGGVATQSTLELSHVS